MGVRAEESSKRKSGFQIELHRRTKQTLYKPIFYWLEWEIWNHIEKNNLPYPSLYDEGFNRIGCVVCPMICTNTMRKIEAHKKRFPKHYLAFEKAARKVFEAGRPIGQPWRESTFEEFLDNWYRGR